MIKKRAPILILVLVMILVLLALTARAEGDLNQLTYFPLVAKGVDQIVPTTTPTLTPSDWFLFSPACSQIRLKGRLTGAEQRDFLTNRWGDVVYPELYPGQSGNWVFKVLFMDIEYASERWDSSSPYLDRTFWLCDNEQCFDMVSYPRAIQWAAADEYGRTSSDETLRANIVYHVVLVFIIPPGATMNLHYNQWLPHEIIPIQETPTPVPMPPDDKG